MVALTFYKTPLKRCPVREFLDGLPTEVSSRIVESLIALGNEMPDVKTVSIRHLRRGLWEVRERIDKTNYRIIYCVFAGEVVLLHAFVKKKGRANEEITLAERRLRDYRERLKK